MHPLAPTVTHAHAHPHHQTKTLTRLHTYTHTLLVPGIHGSTPFAKAVKFASFGVMALPVQNASGD